MRITNPTATARAATGSATADRFGNAAVFGAVINAEPRDHKTGSLALGSRGGGAASVFLPPGLKVALAATGQSGSEDSETQTPNAN